MNAGDEGALQAAIEAQLEASRRGRLDETALEVARLASWGAVFRSVNGGYRDALAAQRR